MRTSPIRARWILVHGVLLLAGAATPATGSVVYVDDDAPAGGDGSSWSSAYRFLQDALASAAGTVTEIRVAQGTYAPDRSEAGPGGTGDRAATFQLLSGVEILGGFAGIGAPDPDARDVSGFATILSGDLNGDDGPPGSFVNNAENSRNVVTANGTDSSAVLDGVTVTGGNADGPSQPPMLHLTRGGGIWNGTGSPTVRDCRIEYNAALSKGGGMYNLTDTSPVITGCTFRGNVVPGDSSNATYGGGLRNYGSNATVTGCVFVDNSSWIGGGMDNSFASTVVVTGCVFTGNTAGFGGGMTTGFNAITMVTDCSFIGNLASTGGGVFVDGNASAVVAGSTFCDNTVNHITGNWSDAGGNSFCPLCDKSSGPVLEVPAVYPTIQSAINAACDGAEVVVSPGTYYERINFSGKAIVVRSTGGPEVTTIDAQGTGTVVVMTNGEDVGTTLEGFTITNGSAFFGGGARLLGANAAFIDCHFRDNVASIAGAIYFVINGTQGHLDLLRCEFDGNQALIGVGAVFAGGGLSAVNCVFTDNDGGQGPGAVGTNGLSTTYVNCLFAGNTGEFLGGGVADGSSNLLMANCVFSRNSAGMGGGMEGSSYSSGVVTNCTFSFNQGGGVGDSAPLFNCILWGNVPEQIGDQSLAVTHSDVQGGWPGTGNIDADPLFVQPGTDDVRLAFGSPCVNAGNNADLPPDTLDLDGDGNTTEPIPFDIGGNPRVQGGTVDMGAWEGEWEPGAPASSESDLDPGDSVILVPEGTGFDPVAASAVIVINTSGPDNASFVATQFDAQMHPDAQGFTELGVILRTQTSLADGEYRAAVFIPFDAAALSGAAPQQLGLTFFDESAGNWALASSGNAQTSPGFGGPIGNRVVAVQGGAWGLTLEVGDYGVFWSPQLQQGFVWANVDHEADFAVGFAMCPSDCLQTPDGLVGIRDLLSLLARWGTEGGGGPCDVNDDGVIDPIDFVAMLGAWGPCQAASAAVPGPGPRRPVRAPTRRIAQSPDLDGNGLVDAADLALLRLAWGPCGNCRADLDGDGRIDVRDMLSLLQTTGSGQLR